MQQTVADIRAGGISDPIAVYAPIPSNYDASLAPPGCQLVVASLYGSPNADVEAWREHALACLFDTVEGLEDAVRFVEFSPIQAVGRWMGKRDQAAICNGQVPGQVGADRLPVTTPFRRVVLTGDGAGGEGIGTEMAAVSGAEAAHALLQETS
jgi:prolycopene isomerase